MITQSYTLQRVPLILNQLYPNIFVKIKCQKVQEKYVRDTFN